MNDGTTKPSIDWSQVNPVYNWLARDIDGVCRIYDRKPTRFSTLWVTNGVLATDASELKSLAPGNCKWQHSLVRRVE